MDDVNASTDGNNKSKPDNTLHKILIALQKSLSRVSANSKDSEHPENARALIVGSIGFELTVNIEPEADASGSIDYLVYKPDGKLLLKLTGSILQDIRAVVPDKTE